MQVSSIFLILKSCINNSFSQVAQASAGSHRALNLPNDLACWHDLVRLHTKPRLSKLVAGMMIKGECETSHLVYKYVPLLNDVSVSYWCITDSHSWFKATKGPYSLHTNRDRVVCGLCVHGSHQLISTEFRNWENVQRHSCWLFNRNVDTSLKGLLGLIDWLSYLLCPHWMSVQLTQPNTSNTFFIGRLIY